jgi:hypothetical protein
MGIYDRDYMKKDDGGRRERRASEWDADQGDNSKPRMSRWGQAVLAILVVVVLLAVLGILRF